MDIVDGSGLSSRQQVSFRESLEHTRITGQRSLAEMYAKEVLSAVEDGAASVRQSFFVRNQHLRVFVSYSISESQIGLLPDHGRVYQDVEVYLTSNAGARWRGSSWWGRNARGAPHLTKDLDVYDFVFFHSDLPLLVEVEIKARRLTSSTFRFQKTCQGALDAKSHATQCTQLSTKLHQFRSHKTAVMPLPRICQKSVLRIWQPC